MCSPNGWQPVQVTRYSWLTDALHIGGNAYDRYNADGILVHKYGPHIFHTNSREVFEYLSRFTEWRSCGITVRASVDGQLLPIPINLDTINHLYGLSLSHIGNERLPGARPAEPRRKILTSEDVVINKVGRELYEKFFRNYTRKQWGLDPFRARRLGDRPCAHSDKSR